MPIPGKVGGRGMTLDLSGCADVDSQTHTLCGESSYFDSELRKSHEEVTFDYLERTHRAGESYETRQRRRHAFQAGMQAGAFVLFPRGLSQTAACDGNSYQIVPNETSNTHLPTGVLPL